MSSIPYYFDQLYCLINCGTVISYNLFLKYFPYVGAPNVLGFLTIRENLSTPTNPHGTSLQCSHADYLHDINCRRNNRGDKASIRKVGASVRPAPQPFSKVNLRLQFLRMETMFMVHLIGWKQMRLSRHFPHTDIIRRLPTERAKDLQVAAFECSDQQLNKLNKLELEKNPQSSASRCVYTAMDKVAEPAIVKLDQNTKGVEVLQSPWSLDLCRPARFLMSSPEVRSFAARIQERLLTTKHSYLTSGPTSVPWDLHNEPPDLRWPKKVRHWLVIRPIDRPASPCLKGRHTHGKSPVTTVLWRLACCLSSKFCYTKREARIFLHYLNDGLGLQTTTVITSKNWASFLLLCISLNKTDIERSEIEYLGYTVQDISSMLL